MLAAIYGAVYNLLGGNHFLINSLAGTVLSTLFFALVNLPFILLDHFQPKWAYQFKIQDDKEVNHEKYIAALRRILPNLLIVSPAVSMTLFPFMPPEAFSPTVYPPITTIVVQVIGFILIEEILFYYSHRALHYPPIYKKIHKIHHEFTAPVSIVSVYCHPIEHVLSNVLPSLLGPVILQAHITTHWIWFTIVLTSTTISHSGYYFPLPPTSKFHDYHHKVFNECFGVLGILDTLHGTNRSFLKSMKSDHQYFWFLREKSVSESKNK